MTSEYPNEYGQPDVAVISSGRSSFFPETQIIRPPTPPFQSHTSQSTEHRLLELIRHSHTCDCGTVFACEMDCRPEAEQQCEYCEVWNLSLNRGTSKQRLADHLDDQIVIDEVRMRAAQRGNCRGTLTGKGDNAE